jgi:hypothetical protein
VSGPPPLSTNTPLPPTPTNTPLPSAEVTFTADNTELLQGQCTRLRWQVRNVAAYFVDGVAGAGDVGDKEVCDPVGTTTHVLRINKRDGSTQDFTVTIHVQATTVPRPNLISPGDNADFRYPDDDVEFVWSAISAPGTVTYNIEIQFEADGNWGNWRRVTGLTEPRYRMNEFAGPRPGRWRVWATSSILGDSAFSIVHKALGETSLQMHKFHWHNSFYHCGWPSIHCCTWKILLLSIHPIPIDPWWMLSTCPA